MGKVKQGVTGDSEMPPLPMSEEDYKATVYERYNCIDERSGLIEEATRFKAGDYVAHEQHGTGVIAQVLGDMASVHYENTPIPRAVYLLDLQIASPKGLLANNISNKTSKAEYYAFVEKTFADMLQLIKRKNADYTAGADDAFANFRRAEPVVPMLEATWVRWGDKIQRVDAFFRNGKLEVANEGLEDALLDVIGYSMIMLGELKEKGNAK